MHSIITNKITPNAFKSFGEFALPKSVRSYLDGGSSEFHEIGIEEKLYHMGYLLKRGYNLYSDFKEDIERHLQDPHYGSYEDCAIHALETYITYLRSRKNTNLIFGDYTFKEVYDMLSIELKMRYKETKHWQTREDIYELSQHITEEDLKEYNGWAKIADKLVGYDLYFENEELVYPDDGDLIQIYNAKKKDCKERFVLQVPPEPWNGDILNSKIVVLSLNPGYVEHLNKDLANMFKAQVAEEIMEDKRQMLRLEQKSVAPHKSTNILGACYWENALAPLGIATYGASDFRKVYSNVAILQFLAYTSAVKSLPAELLPSQQYTRMIIRYLAEEKKETKFLLMRSAKEWSKLLEKDIWLLLTRENRLIISDNYRNQAITEKNVGEKNFELLVDALSESEDE